MPAYEPTQTDQLSIDCIFDSLASELQGMAWLFCDVLVPGLKGEVVLPTTSVTSTVTTADVDEVKKQVRELKSILCGYTAKESAIAKVIGATTKKQAADEDIDPAVICKCLNCECQCDS